MMTKRRRLSDEDRALWSGFARSIIPLRRSAAAAKPAVAALRGPARPSTERYAAA